MTDNQGDAKVTDPTRYWYSVSPSPIANPSSIVVVRSVFPEYTFGHSEELINEVAQFLRILFSHEDSKPMSPMQSSDSIDRTNVSAGFTCEEQEYQHPTKQEASIQAVEGNCIGSFSSQPHSAFNGAPVLPVANVLERHQQTTNSASSGGNSLQSFSNAKIRQYQADQWSSHYEDLVHYYRRHGPGLVDPRINKRLANWGKRQRIQYKYKCDGKKSSLTSARQAALDELGFVWGIHAAGWDERYKDLLNFKKEHGHVNVPTVYPPNTQLGIWVKTQRRQYRQNKGSKDESSQPLTRQRIDRLNHVGFEWEVRARSKSKGSLNGE